MNDLPIFLQMFVRLFAALALGAWLHTLAPRTTEKPDDSAQARPAKETIHAAVKHPAKPCPAAAPTDGK